MKQLLLFAGLVLSLSVIAGEIEKPKTKPLVPNGHWEKVTIMGTIRNITAPGQNKVVAFACEVPKNVECLHYYVWVPDGTSGQISCGNTEVVDNPPYTVPINESFIYLGINGPAGEAVYELNTVTEDCENPDGSVIIGINPGIDQP
ncbi:MAG: hypothetical protein WC760_07005 [Bacteroidia bacterium]|jgi:hypothetical protein